jgi:iron complex transport system permease protein
MPNFLRNSLIFILLTLLLIVFFLFDIAFGSINISLSDIFEGDGIYHEIIYNFRLPKALTAVITGAAISAAGLIMQTLFKNPLADPYILGISSGASLGVAVFLLGSGFMPAFLIQSGWGLAVAAICGAVFVLLLVLGVSFKVRQAVSLLIIGIMFGQIAGSLVTILQNQSNPDALKVFITWTFGSLQAVTWNYMKVMLPMVLCGFLLVFLIQKQLNGLLLGEHYAKGLGINIVRTRVLIIIASALLAGTPTAFTGPIAFIGMAVPHLARGLFRSSNHSITIPATMLCGAILLLFCDLAAVLIPAEGHTLPINAISTLIGSPIVVWVILKTKK